MTFAICQGNWELATLRVRNTPTDGEECKWLHIYESSYELNCGKWSEDMIDHHSHTHLRHLWNESLKKIRLERDSNPWPLLYQLSYQANWELVTLWVCNTFIVISYIHLYSLPSTMLVVSQGHKIKDSSLTWVGHDGTLLFLAAKDLGCTRKIAMKLSYFCV